MIEIELPWPDKRLSPNSTNKWAKIKAKEDAKIDAWWCAFESTGARRVQRKGKKFEAHYTFHPPDKRHRDIDNCLAMMKAAQDGVCEYIEINDNQIKRTILEWGEVVKGGKVILKLEELSDG